MAHFIELTQIYTPIFADDESRRSISVAVEHIQFYYENGIVLVGRPSSIKIVETKEEITRKIETAQKGE